MSRHCTGRPTGSKEAPRNAHKFSPASSVGCVVFGGRPNRISPEVSSLASTGTRHEAVVTAMGWPRPAESRGCSPSAPRSWVSSVSESMRPPGVSPPAMVSAQSSTRSSAGERRKGRFIGRALNGTRPPLQRPSNVAITFPRARLAASVGGRMTVISKASAGSPAFARRRRGPACGSSSRATGLTPSRAGRGVAVSLPRGAGFSRCKWCRPIATECAQMRPASRAERQVQRLSMSTGPLMTSPAR